MLKVSHVKKPACIHIVRFVTDQMPFVSALQSFPPNLRLVGVYRIQDDPTAAAVSRPISLIFFVA